MLKERIAQLIARKLSGEASPEEIAELQALFHEYPADAYFASLLSDYWTTPRSSAPDAGADSEAAFRYILDAAAGKDATADKATASEENEEDLSKSNLRPFRRFLSFAAAFMGLLFLSWWFFKLFQQQGPPVTSRIETVAKPGARSRLLLPDGSTIWLNSGSRISYPSNFPDSRRDVELEGEAYFDVAKNPGRPFFVHTRDIDIKVLGTVFNVKCYPGDDKTEATLIRGLVQISRTDSSQQEGVILHPHEKAVFNRAGRILPENVPDTGTFSTPSGRNNMMVHSLKKGAADTSIVETAWVYNKLVFDGEDFREIAAEMERWFNVKIFFNDPAVARYRFHAEFENESIDQVLSALRLSLPFTFKINNNEINIYK